ncbi:2-dehydropantoate 2-reductase [Zoogloea sp.]|uniref:ketopantoate reductase family protein n=1 Tax=Zoogloea sp. TaxID=49181 RepID=UPI00263318F3|nr:2-dehydropantoate 2-reductase [Zoogloea sp.]MDD3352024.1 2-dehydropantoate 2-reductase [Zoogloea sp.]
MSAPAYPLAIIGAGALGLHFAARLATQGPVALLARSDAAAARLRAGIQVGSILYRPDAFGPEAVIRAEWVIVLVKAGDTAAAARRSRSLAPQGVVSLQNGLTEPLLRASCGDLPAGQGITTEGAWRDANGIHPSGAGETLLPPGFEAVAEALEAAGFQARVEPEIAAARLAKLLVNVAINPLAALFRVPNGALLEEHYRRLLDALVAEAWPVLRAAGLALDEADALARVYEVARATGANRASMLQDVEAGRPTEIDAITGALLALAKAQGLALPTHQALYTLIRQLAPHF